MSPSTIATRLDGGHYKPKKLPPKDFNGCAKLLEGGFCSDYHGEPTRCVRVPLDQCRPEIKKFDEENEGGEDSEN